MIAVRWYLRYGLSYRDVEELLAAGPCPLNRPSSGPTRWRRLDRSYLSARVDGEAPCPPQDGQHDRSMRKSV